MTDLREAQKTFPLSIEAPRSARRWLHASGVVPSELADSVDLVVSELVTNSVTHSGLGASDGEEPSSFLIPTHGPIASALTRAGWPAPGTARYVSTHRCAGR